MSVTEPGGHLVLVVDDTDSKRYILASWLRRAGHRVEEASTGTEALRRCAQGDVDLVVLDVHLPDVTGLEVCRQLKSAERTAAVPVLHISAVAVEPQDRSAGLDFGADAYLVDPIEPRELMATVAALLRYYDARRAAESLVARLRRLGTATLRINAALSVDAVLLAAADAAVDVLEMPAAVLARSDDGTWSVVSAAPGAPTGPARAVAADRIVPLLAALRAPVGIVAGDDPAWASVVPPAGPGLTSWITPVRNRLGDHVAALVLASAGVPPAAVSQLARQLALVVWVALENRRTYAEANRIALTLQRSLLPVADPRLRGLEVAARYNASSEIAEIGGDFFDAFELADGTAVVAIGDVQGHSLQAATIMGELRHGLRAYAHEGHTAASLVTRLNQLMLREHPDITATLCVLGFDPERRTVTIVNAGHIPPLLVQNGYPVYLEESVTLLGIEAVTAVPFTVALQPGTRLVLVTDGLVERRTASLDEGLERLVREVAALAGAELPWLADALMRDLGAGSEDDTALIAVEVSPWD